MDDENLKRQLSAIMNTFGIDNECGTPDYILAEYLIDYLISYNKVYDANRIWHGLLFEERSEEMMNEKLEKEADTYAEKHAFRIPYDGSDKFYDDVDYKASKEGYIAGAEPREKQIAELEERIKNQAENLRVTLLEEDRKAKQIIELEKENEELKEQVKKMKHENKTTKET